MTGYVAFLVAFERHSRQFLTLFSDRSEHILPSCSTGIGIGTASGGQPQADMEGKAPVFTSAPPDHLLKFAPTELEEGYDHDETNAAAIEEDVSVGTGKKQTSLPFSFATVSMELLVFSMWLYLFYGRLGQGTFYHRWSHGIISQIPIPGNPYRTTDNTKPLPYDPCFRTNVDDPPTRMKVECQEVPLEKCPPFATCYGGQIQTCEDPYLQVAGDKCEMVPSVARIYNHVVQKVTAWSMDSKCDREAHSALFENYDESPAPYMMAMMQDETDQTPSREPMFQLDYILDLEPFLLLKAPRGGKGGNPIQSLYHVVDAANEVSDHWLKLQVMTKYGEVINSETGDRKVVQVHLVARVPTKDVWWKRQLSGANKCNLWMARASVEFAMRTPWLISVWFGCMVLFVAWLVGMRYYWKKAQEQQQVLTAIEGVRKFVLETLETSHPKQWKGKEMLEFVVRSGPTAGLEETLLRKRIWPRVCFDVRGNSKVAKHVVVSSGDLVDMWTWQPQEETGQDS